ncbi:MAG: hypothetical protein IKV47_04035, partial [Oscillospiraceae bacterium]|nr:hypothetical protein [Oscillospiraceae bacterium]
MKDLKIVAASGLEALKKMGAQSASVSATYSEIREFNVDGGEFSLFRTLFDNSLVLTAIKDAKKGTAQVNHFDDEAIGEAAASCIAAADAGEPDEAWEFAPGEGEHSFCEGVYEPDLDLLFERCREFMADLSQQHPSIMMEQMIVKHKKYESVFATSNGSVFTEKGGYYNISLMYSAHEGDKSSSFFGSEVSTTDLSVPFMQIGSIKRDLTDVEKQIYPKPVEGKFEGTVVFTPGCFMEAVYYALASFTDGSSILDGTSLWKDKLGEKVANDCLTVTLAPHREGAVGGDNWTGEGYLTDDCDIIKDGVLCSFLMNKYFANKTGQERTKNMDIHTLTAIQKYFCEVMTEKGFQPMIYFNWHQSENLLILSELEAYPFWLALYQDRMRYPWKVEMWQYTDQGRVPGIQGNVDLNVYMP